MAITQKPLRPRRHLVRGQLPIMPNLRSPSFGFEIFSVLEIRPRRDSWCFVHLQYDCLCPLVGFTGTVEKWQTWLFYQTETECLSSFDFPGDPALPHGPTPSVNFTNVFGRLVRDRIFAIWTLSLTIWRVSKCSLKVCCYCKVRKEMCCSLVPDLLVFIFRVPCLFSRGPLHIHKLYPLQTIPFLSKKCSLINNLNSKLNGTQSKLIWDQAGF